MADLTCSERGDGPVDSACGERINTPAGRRGVGGGAGRVGRAGVLPAGLRRSSSTRWRFHRRDCVLAIPLAIVDGHFRTLLSGDQTINAMTLGGLALAIGILVDQSIVVLENVVRHASRWARRRPQAALGRRHAKSPCRCLVSTTHVRASCSFRSCSSRAWRSSVCTTGDRGEHRDRWLRT